jgi:hypothetical protein
MRGCKGGRFAATRRYFVSLFVEPWRASGDQRLAVAKKPSRKSASEVKPTAASSEGSHDWPRFECALTQCVVQHYRRF